MFNGDEDLHEPYEVFISQKGYNHQNIDDDIRNRQNQRKLNGHSLSFLQRRAATAAVSRCQDGGNEANSSTTPFHVTNTCNATANKTTSFATSTTLNAPSDTTSIASHKFSLDRGRSQHNQLKHQQKTSNDSQADSQVKYATCSLKYRGKLLSSSFNTFDFRRLDRANSISNCSNDSRVTFDSSLEQQPHSFISRTNMIAKLASSSTSATQKPGAGQASTAAAAMTAAALQASNSVPSTSAQSKRKRSKLLDLLLNTNWSKQSQQASHLMKLNKVLLFCDANFLDEKTGESPLSLAITSPQINELQTTTKSNRSRLIGSKNHTISSIGLINGVGCPQSTSLFDLQNQHSTTSHSQLTLRQTSSVEISQSKAPLVERILLLLIKSGAILDFRNSDGRTPLHVAAKNSNFWALKTLLDLGASSDSRDTNGLTPLFLSVLHKAELKVTQLLLNHINLSSSTSSGSTQSIGISDQHGWQAIHYAAKYGLSGHIEKLLYYGCDINAIISGSGNTPLHVAAINDQLQVAQVLLLRGADRTITNNSHQNAHQVAVISNNMELAEFIASHDETKVVPFSAHDHHARCNSIASGHSAPTIQQVHSLNRSSISSAQQSLVKSDSSSTNLSDTNLQAHHNFSSSCTTVTTTLTGIVQPQLQEQQQLSKPDHHHHHQQQQQQQLNPLILDVANHYASSISSSAPTTNTSGASHQTGRSSLLSIDTSSLGHNKHQSHNQQLNVQVSNISPCLSQRSCATSNTTTTSSSGVCCDGDGHNSEDMNQPSGSSSNKPDPPGCPSNVTIISIANNVVGKDNCNIDNRATTAGQRLPANQYRRTANEDRIVSTFASCGAVTNGNQPSLLHQSNSVLQLNGQQQLARGVGSSDLGSGDQSGSESGSSSSSDGLYSIMSERKPLYVGSMVKATNCYESGDPKHLQLRREDLIEILECPVDLVQDGQLPRLANKPMLYGRRQSDGACGLFPSFCVRRSKRRLTAAGALRTPLLDVTNSSRQQQQHATANERQSADIRCGSAAKLPESQSMAAIEVARQQESPKTFADVGNHHQGSPKVAAAAAAAMSVSFREFKVTLEKINEGFGFVLRGARIDPATLSSRAGGGDTPGKISIDENLMAANKLASLQYFSDIEPNSIAHQNGLKRGDFLVSVNSYDVRLCSHEQVVQMIRQSGDSVHLTIARIAEQPIMSFSSKTLTRVKPAPPKRDPNTTLTRNKASRIKSMFVTPQQHQQQAFTRAYGDRFDADKPLPETPMMMMNSSSPIPSLNRSVSTNLSHFSSANSLSSAAPDSQSITSISTIESSHVGPNSSSSTTTLITVATTKPRTAPKPNDLYPKAQLTSTAIANPQATYQPAAVITTSKRPSQDQASPHGTHAMTTAPQAIKQSNAASHVPAPPPPPPPPMPDFSAATAMPLSGERLSQRRTSAPVSQATPMIKIDRNQLLKKRDSLASVAVSAEIGSSAANVGAAPICTVAAACAAAANNRLQRQQQRQQGLTEKDSQERQLDESGVQSEVSSQGQVEEKTVQTAADSTPTTTVVPTPHEVVVESKEVIKSNEQVQDEAGRLRMGTVRRDSNHLVTHTSATLGRKSSAQIIQQPKHNSNTAAHSQTLKMVTTKRMSILDHDVFPQPPAPPSLPPPPMFAENDYVTLDGREIVDKILIPHKNQTHVHGHHHHQRPHSHHQQHQQVAPIEHHQQRGADRHQMNQMQMQNQQHQMIMRQQQQLRQHQQLQERIRLQQLKQQQQVQQQQQSLQQCPHHQHRHLAQDPRNSIRSGALSSREYHDESYRYAHQGRGGDIYQQHQQPNHIDAVDMMTTPTGAAQYRHQHPEAQQKLHHTLPSNYHSYSHQHQNSNRHANQHQHQPHLVSNNDNLRSTAAHHHQHLSHHHHSHQHSAQQSAAHYQIEQQQQQYMQQLDPRIAPIHR